MQHTWGYALRMLLRQFHFAIAEIMQVVLQLHRAYLRARHVAHATLLLMLRLLVRSVNLYKV